MKPDLDVITAFEIGVIYFDKNQIISHANAHFQNLFAAPQGAKLSDIVTDFDDRKFAKTCDTPKGYRVHMPSEVKKRAQFDLIVRSTEQGFIGIVQDSSALARSEAMLASYSLLIEKQNREIIRKNKQIEIWRTRIESELEQAAHVQNLLVPIDISNGAITSRCRYLREMSGDFHEIGEAEDGSTTLIVGDVAGKGIYAAIMLAQTLTAFRSCFQRKSLTDVICGMIDMLEGRFPDGLFVALTLVRQSADKQKIELLNLGNPDALVIDDTGDVHQLGSVGPAIGILPSDFYHMLPVEEITLTNKRLLVFSDGLLDANLGDDFEPFTDCADIATNLIPQLDLFGDAPLDSLFEIISSHQQEDDIVISHLRP